MPDDSLEHGMPTLRNKLMTEVHRGLTAMHIGTNRSEYEIRRHAYWPRIRNGIHNFLAACTKRQQNKINRVTHEEWLGTPYQDYPWPRVGQMGQVGTIAQVL